MSMIDHIAAILTALSCVMLAIGQLILVRQVRKMARDLYGNGAE